MNSNRSNTDIPRQVQEGRTALRIHRILVLCCYALGFVGAFLLAHQLARSGEQSPIAVTAIIAGLGTALIAVSSIWERDKLGRMDENVDILWTGILESESWRRWPFLPRLGAESLYTREEWELHLENPSLPFDAGSHVIQIDVPTVRKDLFDLPAFKNLFKLCRFRKSVRTKLGQDPEESIELPRTGQEDPIRLEAMDFYMAYECLLDIWYAGIMFRLARYGIHSGVGLIIGGIGQSLVSV